MTRPLSCSTTKRARCARAYSSDTSSSIRQIPSAIRRERATRSTTALTRRLHLTTLAGRWATSKERWCGISKIADFSTTRRNGSPFRDENDHGDGTHHRHVGGDLDPEYSFPGSVAAVYERFWCEIGVEPFGPSPEDYDI